MHEIEELKRQGLSINAISKVTGCDRKTIRKYLAQPEAAPVYGPREPRPSKLDAFKSYTEERLKAGVWNARVLLRELRKRGYASSYTILTDWLRPQRESARVIAVRRFETPIGHQAQVDWGHLGTIDNRWGNQQLSTSSGIRSVAEHDRRTRWSAVGGGHDSRDKCNTAGRCWSCPCVFVTSAPSAASTPPSPTTPPFLLWPAYDSTDCDGEKSSNCYVQNVGSSIERVVIREWSGARGGSDNDELCQLARGFPGTARFSGTARADSNRSASSRDRDWSVSHREASWLCGWNPGHDRDGARS